MTISTRFRRSAAALASTIALGAVAACGGGGGGSSATGPIQYWLWDSQQQPGYQKCADAFEAQNPGLTINIVQFGWADYWSKVTAGLIADTAPDVFTNHLAKFAQFVDLRALRPLDELAPTSDISDSDYQAGLAELWKGQDGKRYGAPKDWDTMAVFYDAAAVREAGIDPAQLQNLDWNPVDGGSFEKAVAHLTVDANGVRGDEPGFDKNNVVQHGFASGGGGGDNYGQAQWSSFTGSTGWQVTDRNPWGRSFNFDDPAFQDTMRWYFGLVEKGYMPTYTEIGGAAENRIGSDKQIQSGMAAMGINGSWMISTFSSLTDVQGNKIEIGVAPTPIGPSGKRASMFNGLADSITAQSRQPENAAKWVKFLSGAECQQIIGSSGVVFPARPAGTELAVNYNRTERDLDVTPFTEQVAQKTTFLFPVTTNAADVIALTEPRFDAVYIGTEPVSTFTDLNDQLNKLLEVAQ
jgi:multiple sugar transport system substrate-binding protein